MRRRDRLLKVFYFKTLSKGELIVLSLYIALSLFVLLFYRHTNLENKCEILVNYAMFSQVLLYVFGDKSLPNMSFYLFWIAIGLCHLGVYFLLRGDALLIGHKGQHEANGTRNTILLLLLYQLLRITSVKLFNREMVCPANLVEDINTISDIKFFDALSFIIYILALFVLMMTNT